MILYYQQRTREVMIMIMDVLCKLFYRESATPTTQNDIEKRAVPYYENYPREKEFYSIVKEEYGGLIPIHSVRTSFSLPYSDWCEFQKSEVYQFLSEYLEELHKRYILNQKTDKSD